MERSIESLDHAADPGDGVLTGVFRILVFVQEGVGDYDEAAQAVVENEQRVCHDKQGIGKA